MLLEEVVCRYLQEEAMNDFCQDLTPPPPPTPLLCTAPSPDWSTLYSRKLKSFLAAWFQYAHRARIGLLSYKHSLAGCTHMKNDLSAVGGALELRR